VANLDTHNKRRGGTGKLFFPMPSVADGTIGASDRYQAVGIYGGNTGIAVGWVAATVKGIDYATGDHLHFDGYRNGDMGRGFNVLTGQRFNNIIFTTTNVILRYGES